MTGKQRRKLRKKVSRLAAKPEKMEGETSFLGKGEGGGELIRQFMRVDGG